MNSSKTSRKDKLLEKGLLARARREEDKKYTAIVQAALDGFWVNDLEGRFLEVNDSYCRMIGYTREELLTMSIPDVEALEKPEETAQRIRKIIKRGYDRFETCHRHKDGKIIDIEVSVNYVDVDGGRMVVFLRDITERKKAEGKLRESEAKFRGLFENIPDGIFQTTPDDRILAVNPALVRMLGYESEEELLKAKPSDMWMKPEKRKAYIKKLEREGVQRNFELHLKRKNGQEVVVLENTHVVRDEQGRVLYYEGTMTDITERRRIEEALKKSEEEYRALLENARDIIVTFDLKGNVTSVNRAVEEYGFKKKEIVGESMLQFVSEKYRPEALKELAEIARGNQVEGEIGLITPKGEKIAEYRGNPTMLGKKVVGSQAIFRDITERKQMEEALRASEERYRTVIEGMHESLAIVGEDQRIEYVNPEVWRQTGYKPEELIGERFDRFLTPESVKIATENYEKRRRGERVPSVYEVQAVTKDGALKDFQMSVSICSEAGKLKTVVVFEDVTERKRMLRDLESYSEHLEELVEERTNELRETERMAAVGETAAMVGHDLRNPLQTMANILYLMKSTPPRKKRHLDLEEELMRQVNFMDSVIINLQEYARPIKPELTETGLRQLINETLSTTKVPDNVQVSLTIPENLRLMVDTTLMRRVFTNLIANALEAMPKGGKLTVTATKRREVTYISVGDTGAGIPEKMLDKVFRPLPTTKPGGTGLGLVIVKRLVDAHGGTVAVESKVGRGTVFTVKLPLRGGEKR